jgi:alpha-galactosidase
MLSTAVPVAIPDLTLVQLDPQGDWSSPNRAGVLVRSDAGSSGALSVRVATTDRVSRVVLRWRRPIAEDVVVLGDAWERSYGDLQWRGLQPERMLPWTALWHHGASGTTTGVGVEVRGGAFAGWTVDPEGFSLWLDLRCGGVAVRPGERVIDAAVVRGVSGTGSPFKVQQDLYSVLCTDPLRLGPLVGANNWYYAYGRDFDRNAVLRDARTASDLIGSHPVRPFDVVDDGWSVDGTADGRPGSGGPWDTARAASFPAGMEEAAAAIAGLGVRPGIWFRPLLSRVRPGVGELTRPRSDIFGAHVLDVSSPATLQTVADDIARFVGWGYELIKHDFSTFDLVGQWGVRMGAFPGRDGWSLNDPTVTTAEALVRFYWTIHEAAGDAVILGCNVVGHLAAGLIHGQRIGDDTSGHIWSRTRRTGVNALAFRLAQHRRLFAVDADCVPSTPQTPWTHNCQWLDLVSRSGTALFVSVDPATRNDTVDADLSNALRRALDGGDPAGVEPLDWLHTTSPTRWRTGQGEVTYRWSQDWGSDPFEGFELVLRDR